MKQRLLLSSPEAVEKIAPLFPTVAVSYANGSLPDDVAGEPDVIAFGPQEWAQAIAEQAKAAGCAKVRYGAGDIAEIDTDLPGAWLRDRITEFTTSAPAVNPSASDGSPPSTEAEQRGADPEPAGSLDEPPIDPQHPAWVEIPEEAAEVAVQPYKKRQRPRLAAVEGNLARAWPEPDIEPLPQSLSEDSLADHFCKEYGTNWRYVTEWGMWLQWRGDGWHRDKRNEVTDVFKIVTRDALQWRDAQSLTPDGKRRINSKRTAWNSRDIAAADRRISILADELDADPFLLGVPGGVVDLTNGKLLEAEPEQYITRRTSVAPEPGEHPLFDRVLSRACAGHDGMREYLLRWFGYFLTGDVREEAFMFLYGPGGSGKSTLIKAIADIMGEYAVAISMDAFTESKHPRHSQEIAKLAGMRLVYASETDEGRRWNEALIKSLTGRDKITAHKMRMDDFEFDPTFKLLLFGNSIPHLKSVGEEIRRRIHLVEYAGSLTETERDNTLKDRLVAEYPAILHTLIQGCVDWQDCKGLGKPESVSTSVDAYLEGEDSMAMFLAECVEIQPGHPEPSGALYRRYKNWAMAAGEYVGSQKRFVTALKQRGFEGKKTGGARFIVGLKLKASEPEYEPQHWQHD